MKKSHSLKVIQLLLFSILGLYSLDAQAQVLAPDLLCVKNDTLVWVTPINNCGTFNAYHIFASQNINGPYDLLASISEPNLSLFVHVGGSIQNWFYYMESDYDCPGETVLQSDTLDNRLPQIASIQAVSVSGSEVQVSWNISPSPEVAFYIVYRITPNGTIPIDTVFSGTTYTDTEANPENQEEFYYVLAADECGNTSIFDDPHHTIKLETSVSSCEQSIALSWGLYENWTNGIGIQEIWVSIDGAAPILEATIGASATNYTFENANDATEYCFFVRAIEANTNIGANSNQVCQVLDIVQPNRNLSLNSVTVTANNEVELNWNWDSNAEINTYRILRSTDNMSYSEILNQAIAPPLPNNNIFVDENALPQEGLLYYYIETRDDCDSIVLSNYFSTVHLSGTPQDNQANILLWTAPDIQNGTVQTYELFRVLDGAISSLGTFDSAIQNFEDAADLSNAATANLCYYVEATISLVLPDGSTETAMVQSNWACIEQFAKLLVPNAFTPTGKNPEFKPTIFFGETATYQMRIFDRWGGLIFESTNPNVGWKGRGRNGNLVQQGVYMYLIELQQENGRLTRAQGPVMVLK